MVSRHRSFRKIKSSRCRYCIAKPNILAHKRKVKLNSDSLGPVRILLCMLHDHIPTDYSSSLSESGSKVFAAGGTIPIGLSRPEEPYVGPPPVPESRGASKADADVESSSLGRGLAAHRLHRPAIVVMCSLVS